MKALHMAEGVRQRNEKEAKGRQQEELGGLRTCQIVFRRTSLLTKARVTRLPTDTHHSDLDYFSILPL